MEDWWCVYVPLFPIKASSIIRTRHTKKNGWITDITRLSAILNARKGCLHFDQRRFPIASTILIKAKHTCKSVLIAVVALSTIAVHSGSIVTIGGYTMS